MCGIGGIVSKKGENVTPLVAAMLTQMRNRGPDGVGIAADSRIIQSDSVDGLQCSEIRGSSVLGHARLAIVGGTCGSQPFRSCDGKLVVEHNGEIYNYKDIRKRLEKHHNFRTNTDSEVIVHLLEDHYNSNGGNLLDAIKKTVAELDGIYALAIRDEMNGTFALVRDRLGVRQLYYGENDDFIAFASEKKPLWSIGIREPTKRVMPGYAVLIPPTGRISSFKIAELTTLQSLEQLETRIQYKTMNAAVNAYRKALIKSMEKRTQDFKRIGIVFSGGIDSVLVAHLAKRMVPEVVCYTCGIKGSNDIDYSRQIAKKLDLDLQVNELTEDEVEQLIPEIIHVIEENNAGQVEVAIPVFGAVKKTHEQGIRVMLTGQGADELFGGYPWYAKIADKDGYQKMQSYMIEDLLLLYKETLEREDKISMAKSIELREPFLDIDLIKTTLKIDPRLNVKGGDDILGKRVHRELALSLGIPREIAYRIKEAAQHGSGIHAAIDRIARKNGVDESAIPKKYLEGLAAREKIGSSQRYGHLFESHKIWTADPHVQMYLDNISEKVLQLDSIVHHAGS
jgi:asparagine synthase (glutamine-hydrolysing)